MGKSVPERRIIRPINSVMSAMDIIWMLTGQVAPRAGLSGARLLLSSDLGLLHLIRNRRALRFIAKVATLPDMTFDELRLASRASPNRQAVVTLIDQMISNLEGAETDEVIGPMVQLLALHKRSEKKYEQREILAVARLLRNLRHGDVQSLRQLVIVIREASPEEPLMVWHGAKINGSKESVTIVRKSATSVVEVPPPKHAPRLFQLLKQEELAVSASHEGITVNADYLPGDDSSLVMARQVSELLADVLA